MAFARLFVFGLALCLAVCAQSAAPKVDSPEFVDPHSAAALSRELRQLELDPQNTWRARNLTLVRGGIKIYLTEGVISFFKPVAGRPVAALFSTEESEVGDAEIILLPPDRAERASLASFTNSANLDEHFGGALFFFTDDTAAELVGEIREHGGQPAPELAAPFSDRAASVGRSLAGQIDIRLVEALLDLHKQADGFFFSLVFGNTLGPFDLFYDPTQFEPVSAGRVSKQPHKPGEDNAYETWTSFRPRQAVPFVPPVIRVSDYRIEASINPDLALTARARFALQPDPEDGRVVPLNLSPRLQVTSASIDGRPVEVMQHSSSRLTQFGSAETLLLIAAQPLEAGRLHSLDVQFAGNIVRRTAEGDYVVDERNSWYPVSGRVSSNFDLTFHCPEKLRLVSTGELLDERVTDATRTVHRRTVAPVPLAGFNLGDYRMDAVRREPYTVNLYAPVALAAEGPELAAQTADILTSYSRWWGPLASPSVAVSPIAGYFGQGFPGLIYLSSVTYVPERDRPAALRIPALDRFFTDLLLPHEIAHQWWGNIVRSADYRTSWLPEAMATDASLEYLAGAKGAAARDDVLKSYRDDLVHERGGKLVDASGPLDFGDRLLKSDGMFTWHVITYEKGAWILQMLRERMGEEAYRQFERKMLEEYRTEPISNDDLRKLASRFLPVDDPDRKLAGFFDTWVYNTGIPRMSLRKSGREVEVDVSGVDDDFLMDVPLACKGSGAASRVRWLRASAGDNTLSLGGGMTSCELPPPRNFLYVPVH